MADKNELLPGTLDLLMEAGIDAPGIRSTILKRWPDVQAAVVPLSAAG